MNKLEEFLKEEYKSLAELVEDVPQTIAIIKWNMKVGKKKARKIVVLRELNGKLDAHASEIYAAYIEDKGVFKRANLDKLRKELSAMLIKHLNIQKFMTDYLNTLQPADIIEAYDRAIVKKGKVRDTEGCYKFLIFGRKGEPMQLMLRD